MGSSSKKSGGSSTAAAAPAPPPPTMATSAMPDGSNMQYYANMNEVPQSGGLIRPTAGAGMLQGAGLNMYTPPPPPPPPPIAPRTALANTMNSGTTTPMGGQTQGGLYNNNAGSRSYRGGRNSR